MQDRKQFALKIAKDLFQASVCLAEGRLVVFVSIYRSDHALVAIARDACWAGRGTMETFVVPQRLVEPICFYVLLSRLG